MVAKLAAYEEARGGSWRRQALLVADASGRDEFDFEAATERTASLIPLERVERIHCAAWGDAAARAQVLSSLQEGLLLVHYLGHGSVELWRGGLLDREAVESLENGSRLPLVVSLTCLNGFFHDMYTESLAEALLRSPGGGAVAVGASSGLTPPEDQEPLDREMLHLLFGAEPLTVGEAAARAKAAVHDPDVRRTWILFGDPSLRLR